MSEPCLQSVMYMPLSKAVLCEDCRAVSNGRLVCPACGSSAIANIAPWLQERETGVLVAPTSSYAPVACESEEKALELVRNFFPGH